MKKLTLHTKFEYRTGFLPIYQIQTRGKSMNSDGWSEEWRQPYPHDRDKSEFDTMDDALAEIATYHPNWFLKHQARVTQLESVIQVKATEPLPFELLSEFRKAEELK